MEFKYTIRYRCFGLRTLIVPASVWNNFISDISKIGFWITHDFELVNGIGKEPSNTKHWVDKEVYWIPPSQILMITKTGAISND